MKHNTLKSFSLFLVLVTFLAGGCAEFLNEEPNRAGSAYIYHMDQLYEMTGSPDLYMFYSPGTIGYGKTGSYWDQTIYLNDFYDIAPEMFVYGYGSQLRTYPFYCLDRTEWTESSLAGTNMDNTWTPSWERIYRFNTVIENIDRVEQTTAAIHDQVLGEAYFGRAYYHFLLLVQYCLWDDNQPGLGYRENTNPGEIPARETVKYTVDKIYADLDQAETLMKRAGRTDFYKKTNFRPSLPAVQAFRARVDLYRGHYASARQNAEAALQAHSTLVAFKDDPDYMPMEFLPFFLLNEDNTQIAETIMAEVPMMLWFLSLDPVQTYDELFLTSMTQVDMQTPMSEKFYNLFDRANDARWSTFYNNYYPFIYADRLAEMRTIDGMPTPYCITWENQQWLKPSYGHAFVRFQGYGAVDFLGMTTAEMMLIKAEALAREGNSSGAADELKKLRRTRFNNMVAADNIGGSVQEVLDERSREMGALWRFFDIKRLNGAEHANISLNREILADQTSLSSRTNLTVGPEDGRWALPFYGPEAKSMGWEQNKGWE